MKFQTIFILSVLIVSTQSSPVQRGKLSGEENENRLDECGNPNAAHAKIWFWLVSPKGETKRKYVSGAVLISNRHLITSSFSVLTEDGKWRWNGKKFDGKCADGASYAEVPTEVIDKLDVSSVECFDPSDNGYTYTCHHHRMKLVKAHFLNICGSKSNVPPPLMIIEFGNTIWRPIYKTPCISENNTKVKRGDKVVEYGFSGEKPKIINRTLSVSYIDYYSTKVNSRDQNSNSGSPLIKNVDGTLTLIAISVENGYVNVKPLKDDICELTGVCEIPGRSTKIRKTPSPTSPGILTSSDSTPAPRTSEITPFTNLVPETTFKAPSVPLTSSEPAPTTTIVPKTSESLTSAKRESSTSPEPTLKTSSESRTSSKQAPTPTTVHTISEPPTPPMLESSTSSEPILTTSESLTSSKGTPPPRTVPLTPESLTSSKPASNFPTSSEYALTTAYESFTTTKQEPVTTTVSTTSKSLTSSKTVPESATSSEFSKSSTTASPTTFMTSPGAPTSPDPETSSESAPPEDVPPESAIQEEQEKRPKHPMTQRPPEVQKDEEEHDYEEYGAHYEEHRHAEELNFSDDNEENGGKMGSFELILFLFVFWGIN